MFRIIFAWVINQYSSAKVSQDYQLKKVLKLMKSSPLIWLYVVNVKSTVKILSIFVAFLENVNFKTNYSTRKYSNQLWHA